MRSVVWAWTDASNESSNAAAVTAKRKIFIV
jgi:hypothetical protein